MTPEQLAAWKRLAEAATPGEWTQRLANDGTGDRGIKAPSKRNVIAECFADMDYDGERALSGCKANAAFIAASRTALPALIAEVERLRAEAEWRDIATAPRDGTPVLVWVRNHADIAIWKHNILDGWLWNLRREGFFSDRWSEQPTHWRPITPPKDSTNE